MKLKITVWHDLLYDRGSKIAHTVPKHVNTGRKENEAKGEANEKRTKGVDSLTIL